MPDITAQIRWTRTGETFTDGRYSRAHTWRFDGGAEVPASSSPHVVRPPFSDPAGVDPEEAFVASLSSCHMLWLLSIAARRGFVVDDYADDASGTMGKGPDGRMMMTAVTLRPSVRFAGENQPTSEELDSMHHEAHEKCFIANSVKTEVRVEPAPLAM
jgi:organic hydroperoxide reductase OsmC/OhrA